MGQTGRRGSVKDKRQQKEYNGTTPLEPRPELFCVLYTESLTNYYGNGHRCYAFAYNYQPRLDAITEKLITADTRTGRGKSKKTSEYQKLEVEKKRIENVCLSAASRLLINVKVKARIHHFLDKASDDIILDKEAMRVVQQMFDMNAKMRAIERFDKIRGRIIEKVDIKHQFEPITEINHTVLNRNG